MKRTNCIVCTGTIASLSMCRACARSFDRHNRADMTTLGLIRWAANRARRAQQTEICARLDALKTRVGGLPDEADLPEEVQRILFPEVDKP